MSEYNLTGKGYQQYQVMFIILVMAQGLDLSLWPPSKSLQIINAGEGVEKGESFYIVLVGKQTGVATMKTSSSKKQEGCHMIQQSTPGHICREENSSLKRHMHPNDRSSTPYNSPDMEITQVPINRCIYINIYNRLP